jgi:plastocyanin
LSRWLVAAAVAALVLFGRWQLEQEAGAQAQPAGQLSGSVPVAGGLALVVWSGGSLEQLRAAASGRGCVLESVWSVVSGRGLVGFVVGAPPQVNAAFLEAYPGAEFAGRVPLVLVCGARTASSQGAPPPPVAARLTTAIRDNAFESPLEVLAGSTVAWHNADGVSHTVTADDLSADSPFLRTGESFELRFDLPGRFAYCCRLHQQMTGVVIIE